ncbi:MAG TPA: trigger factor [Gemmatimonadota bacterium]|nr:trigger factor [Gemmatimonadota bacterium]
MTTPAIDTASSAIRWEVEELARWRRRLAIQVPAALAARVRDETVRGFARRARIKGFRQGKAPDRLIEQQYGPEIEREVLEDLVRQGIQTGIERSGLDPIAMPEIEDVHWTPDGRLEFAAEFDIRPAIELGRITGFRVERRARVVADEDVDRVLERLRRDRAEWRPVDRGAADGDRSVFDSVPLDDEGRPKVAERVENHRVELGTDSLLPEFEDGLRGLAAGAEETITVALRGAARPFRVTIRAVEERILPALDDAFAASLGSFASLSSAREHIRRNLEAELAQQSEREVNEALIDEVIAANPIDLPESMIERYLGSMLADRQGPLEGRVPAEREAEVRRLLRPGAERAMRRHYILNHIADREGLRASDGDVDQAIGERIDPAQSSVAAARRDLERSGQLDDLRFHLTMERVFAWLREHSEITSVSDE